MSVCLIYCGILKYVDESEINGVGLADILTADGSVVPKGNPPFVGEVDLGAPAEIVLVIAGNVGVVAQSRAGVLGLVGVGDERLERRIQPVAHRRLSKIYVATFYRVDSIVLSRKDTRSERAVEAQLAKLVVGNDVRVDLKAMIRQITVSNRN